MHGASVIGAMIWLTIAAVLAPAAARGAPDGPREPTWTCEGTVATIQGTSGDDILVGTPHGDVIAAGQGDDFVYGLGGDDLLCGGGGHDTILGGPGDDRLVGAGGPDRLVGNEGADTLAGRRGDDRLEGGPGDDTLMGGPGDDHLEGQQGIDSLLGFAGDDLLDGGTGSGPIHGGEGNDQCLHGTGYQACETVVRDAEAYPAGSFGFPVATRSFDAVVEDFDGDGLKDVLITHHANREFYPDIPADGIYLNRGEAFVQWFALPLHDRHGCAAGDVSGDGLMDFYCQIGGRVGRSADKSDELWVQRPDGRFVDEYAAWGVSDPYGRGRYPALIDVDSDGLLDLYLTNSRRDDGLSVSSLWINDGRRFTADPSWGLSGIEGWGPCFATAGEWAVVCTDGSARLFRRAGRRYLEIPIPSSSDWFVVRQAAFGDLDGDGSAELVVIHKDGVSVRYLDDPTQPDIDIPISSGQALAIGDADGDGALDVYVVRGGTGCDDPETAVNRDDVLIYGPDLAIRDTVTVAGGCGDGAAVIDADSDGDDEFIVLNGNLMARGPILLVDVGRRTDPG